MRGPAPFRSRSLRTACCARPKFQFTITSFHEMRPMRYMMLIRHTEDYRNREIPAGLMEAMGEFVTAKLKSGEVIDTAGLKPTSAGKRVRLRGGKLDVIDGPFTEA